MHNRVQYEYAVIRLVPKVEREEFMNIGVILYSKKTKFLDLRYHIDERKITAFSSAVDITMIRKYLEAWELICKGAPDGGTIGTYDMAYRFRWMVANRSTIIQSSPTHPGLCVKPVDMLEDLYERYVL